MGGSSGHEREHRGFLVSQETRMRRQQSLTCDAFRAPVMTRVIDPRLALQ